MSDQKNTDPIPGISLRDWFAGQALIGLILDPDRQDETWKQIAVGAYRAADTMLMVREQTDD